MTVEWQLMKIRLTHKIVALVLLSNLGSASAMIVVASNSVSAELTRQIRAETERCITLLARSFATKVPGASVTSVNDEIGTRVLAPALGNFHDESIVDENVKLLGGTASIFRFDEARGNFYRIATSIKDDRGLRATGTPLALDSPAQPMLRKGSSYSGPTVIFGQPYYAIYQPTFDAHGRVSGVLYAGYPMRRIYYDGYSNIMWRMGVVSLALEAILMLIVSLAGHHLFSPISSVTRRIEGLMQGDLESPVPAFERTDEIGEMAASLAMFRTALVANKKADELNRLRSLGDIRRADMIVETTRSFETNAVELMRSLAASVSAMDLAADQVANSSRETRTEASIVLGAAEEATTVLDSLSVAAGHLSASAATISEEMHQTSAVASTALQEATLTKDQVATLLGAAQEIGGAAHFIERIAHQTNLLALNATIEAANAGEAGRGFAIVAGEVKSLAKRTADATSLIARQIQTIQETSDRTAHGMTAIKATLEHMNAISGAVAAAMSEQGQSSRRIASALAEATGRAQIVLDSIGHVNVTALANGERALDLKTKAAKHGEQAGRLSGFISRFVEDMRRTA